MTIDLINGDCIEFLRMTASKFDLIVTSPPYNAGKKYEKDVTPRAYKRFAKQWILLAADRLSNNGSFWLNVGYMSTGDNQTLPLTYLYHEICPLPLIQEIVWHYEGGMTYEKRFAHRTERWMWFAKNPATANFNLDIIRDRSLNRTDDSRNNPNGKNPTDYWYFNRVTNNSSEKTNHPCQFPEAMIRRIVLGCSAPEDKVLDPFMGSGTVGLVCKTYGRSFTGVESDKGYFVEAKDRIEYAAFTLDSLEPKPEIEAEEPQSPWSLDDFRSPDDFGPPTS